ncbi:MAG: DNA polymerase IV, partial [Anaerolineae bacterium]|nr:DNA polymerase IV [Anaerolineae bacterium]
QPRKILHLDLDAFFCAVEELRDPTLRGQPFAVGGAPDGRGVIAACSYAARQFGIHSAMPTAHALRRCPQLLILPGRHTAYEEYSRRVLAQLYNLTPLVEQISIDEAFLDVTDLHLAGEKLARQLQQAVWEKYELPCSLGVAENKLLAKTANDFGKAKSKTGRPPMAITVIPPGSGAAFLAPLPVEKLWGVGPKTAQRLAPLGIRTIGELAAWPPEELARRFGKQGRDLARRARGIDPRPIVTVHETKSVSRETTFAQDVRDRVELERTLLRLSKSVGWRLRRAALHGVTVQLKLRWADFTTLTRQTTLPHPTNQDNDIYQAAKTLFTKTWQRGRPVRLIGVGVTNLQEPREQLKLWEASSVESDRLQETLDELRERFGREIIQRASELSE